MRALDSDISGRGVGLAVLMTLCSGLIERSVKGGLIVVGTLNLGGSVEMIPNPGAVAELAVEISLGLFWVLKRALEGGVSLLQLQSATDFPKC